MLIAHAYYTDGMHELAKVFVESFGYFHEKDKVPLYIHGVGLTSDQITEIDRLYKYGVVLPVDYDLAETAERCNITLEQLLEWKKQIEEGYVTKESRVWKLLTAGEQRVRLVTALLLQLLAIPKDDILLLHFDIDTLFRGSVLPLADLMKGYDVGLKLRPKKNPIKARITIDLMALSVTEKTFAFLVDWVKTIQILKPRERPVGYGQESCWYAYERAKENFDLKALTLPLLYGLPGRNKEEDVLWCGNIHKLRKDDCVGVFRSEFEKLKERRC